MSSAVVTSAVVTSDGVPIAVHDHGGSGRPLVLAHATGFHGRVWAPLVVTLSPYVRCISYDARAHGCSGMHPEGDLGWDGLARDVLAVVDSLGLERPFGAGHSSGATALLLAEQARPGAFAALYCFEPVVVPADPPLGPDPDSWLASAARRRREVFASRDEAYRTYSSKAPLATLDPEVLQAYVEHGFEDLDDGGVRLRCRREHEAVIDELATAHACFVRLPRVACPVTLACGDTDAQDRTTLGILAARLPRARIEVLPGLGHLGPLQQPAAVGASILRCLALRAEGRNADGQHARTP